VSWLVRERGVRTADVIALGEQRVLGADGIEQALRIAGLAPTAAGWRGRIEQLLFGMAAALFVAGVICVVAANWASIGRWGRFALGQAVPVAVLGLALWRGLDTLAGKILLTVACGLIGPLLALFGQTYQTGADVDALFRAWALLALPWTLASCFAPAWLLWIVVVEFAAGAWVHTFDLWRFVWFGFLPSWLGACALQAALLVLWEVAAHRFDWLSGRFAPRLLAFALLAPLTLSACAAVWMTGEDALFGGLASGRSLYAGLAMWVATLAAGWLAYRRATIELGMLGLGWLSVTVFAMSATVRLVVSTRFGVTGLLLAAAVLFAASAIGRRWLRSLAQEAHAREAAHEAAR
jgi:uncharacterized membrane protein